MVQTVENDIPDVACSSVVHIIGEIVQMKQICQEVVAHAKLRICGVRIAHGGQKSSFQPMVLVLGSAHKIVTFEQPSLRLGGDSFPMTVMTQREVAMRYKIR